MRHLLTVSAIAACVAILTGCATHAVVADSTAEADRPLLLLEETHRLMLELAERDLPRGDIDEGVLAKQRRVIKNLDMLAEFARAFVAEVKLLRILQMEVQFQTSQLAEVHRRRIAAIEADKRLSPARKAQRKRAAEEQKVRLGERLARRQRRIAELAGALLNAIEKTHDKETER